MNVTHQTGTFQVRDAWDRKAKRRAYYVVELDAESLQVWQERQERIRRNGPTGAKPYDDRHYIQAKGTVERFHHDPNGHARAKALCDKLAAEAEGGQS